MAPYDFQYSLDGGYEVTGTLSVTERVLGMDSAKVDNLWSAVGGSGEIPCIGEEVWSGQTSTLDNTVITFATLQFSNGTVEFTPPSFSFDIRTDGTDGNGNAVSPYEDYAFGYVAGGVAHCEMPLGGGALVPQFQDGQSTWGPIPVVFVLLQGRTPEQPDGPDSMPRLFLVTGSSSPPEILLRINR